MENLVHDVVLKTTKFTENLDYVIFLLTQTQKFSGGTTVKETTRKRTYFTYNNWNGGIENEN
jgi:hypothetical protein